MWAVTAWLASVAAGLSLEEGHGLGVVAALVCPRSNGGGVCSPPVPACAHSTRGGVHASRRGALADKESA